VTTALSSLVMVLLVSREWDGKEEKNAVSSARNLSSSFLVLEEDDEDRSNRTLGAAGSG
jgi:hypothetical protein